MAIGDLILTEVLQGLDAERDFRQVEKLLSSLEVVVLGGRDVAVQAARNYRLLRSKGVTVRKTIDTIITRMHRQRLHAARRPRLRAPS